QSLPESVAPPGVTADRPELVCTMLGFALSCVFSLPLNAGMTFVSVIGGTGGAEFSMTAALLSVLTGVTILPVVVFCFRRANLETDDPRINTVAYATPVLALIWLSLATEITIPHPSLLVIGTAAILAANVLLQTDPESRIAGTARLGFRALVVALWSCGAITLTRDDWFLPDALKWSGSSWWEIQALSTTLFAFLLSFRIARLDNRAQKEDDLAIHILHRLEEARSKEQLGAESVKIFLSVTCRGARADLPAAYARLRTALQKSKTAMGSHVLSSLETQIDMFFWSRQRGRDFGEFVAIVALAVITVTIALLSRPTVNGWVGFLTEIFVMIFCANLIYLVVTLADRRRARFSGLFEQSSMSDNHGIPVALDSEERIGFHSFIALLMSFLVVVAFGYAFFEKWIGL
ncbi:MAG: hypothetical protein OXC53_11930, partial [Rhodobacteraceae bacterium]|nr:hypothetical protein [Paracoccaceae bacterium]